MLVSCPLHCASDLEPVVLSQAQLTCRNNVPEHLPYVECSVCGLWFQQNPPPFKYEADDEAGKRKESMLEEKGHYDWLSNRLYSEYRPRSVIDIGSNYPLMLQHMKEVNGVTNVLALDGCSSLPKYADELGVPFANSNFLEYEPDSPYDVLTMVHVIEHFTDPLQAMLRAKKMLQPKGIMFIRTPLNDTEGLTRWHLTEFHLQVHPILFGQKSIRKLIQLSGFELVKESIGNGVGHGDYDIRKR